MTCRRCVLTKVGLEAVAVAVAAGQGSRAAAVVLICGATNVVVNVHISFLCQLRHEQTLTM